MPSLPVPTRVCVLGVGFVGAAMCAALAAARDASLRPRFRVAGLDLPTPEGRRRVEALLAGRFPFETADPGLEAAVSAGRREGNLDAATDPGAISEADVVVVDVGLDVEERDGRAGFARRGFEAAVETVGARLRPGALVVVETTVPPGTCDEIVAPILRRELGRRGLPPDAYLLAHSYERVMPGANYLESVTHIPRVYAGATDAAADACEAFLAGFVAVDRFPLTRLAALRASETGKILENSYRAVNIAFAAEWGRFAEAQGVDLFPVIDAIRVRPTHSNLRQPGFGVGGYCLTKDPLFAPAAAAELLGRPDLEFPFCRLAVDVNRRMPLHPLDALCARLGDPAGRRILLLGISYREEVGDTRCSPSETFRRAAESRGMRVTAHDPLVRRWDEFAERVPAELPAPAGFDAVVFAVGHGMYRGLDLREWLGDARPLLVDANHVLPEGSVRAARELGCPVFVVGRGDVP